MAQLGRTQPLILIVDDEFSTIIMLQYIFEREGYQVAYVTDGLEAAPTAAELLPELILLDILLPHINGFEVLKRLKDQPATQHIPTILITANMREPSDLVMGLNLGADDYLYKPFAPQELLARVKSKLRARQLEDNLRKKSQELEALLAASERINQFIQRDEIIMAAVDLIRVNSSAEAIVIQLVDEDVGRVIRAEWADSAELLRPVTAQAVSVWLETHTQSVVWFAEAGEQYFGFDNGAAILLTYLKEPLGIMLVLSGQASYAHENARLLEGIGRHIVLALRNAELYELQNAYAQQLEETIQTRTEELLSAQRLLIRNEKLASIGHLAANIAHEINNPLMPITLLLENLEDTLRAEDAQMDLSDLGIVRENVSRIQRVVRSLLDFARQEAELRPVDAAQSLAAIEKLNRHAFEMERKVIRVTVVGELTVFGSKDQLEAAFMNLTLNARASLLPRGELHIHGYSDERQDEVVVVFSDTGSGIAPENLDRIFDPFYSTKPTGTGLGLFVTYGILQAHSGSITVASELGKGTTFTIRLPRSQGLPRQRMVSE